MFRGVAASLGAAGLLLTAAPVAAQQVAAAENFEGLSIEQLAAVEITSVSRSPQALATAPAAIFVINQDDIRRSTGTSIPEILRLAPNLQVAQLSASSYGITARGFNHSTGTANKLLVMMDGRVVYSPLFSGVFWDTQNTVLNDIDRIEVISGPAGTLWGSNAVNGVINITSRSSKDTQGSLFDIRAGSLSDTISARHGGTLDANTTYRVYVTALHDRNLSRVDGLVGRDGWDNVQGGFRTDWENAGNAITLQGDLYRGKTEPVPGAVANGTIGGQNLLASWTSHLDESASFKAQVYYDNARRVLSSGIRASVDTFDFDAQYNFAAGPQHAIVVGGGYRITDDKFVGGPGTSFLVPGQRRLGLGNIFAQDAISLAPDLTLTLGLKLEHNSYTGWEAMPDSRLAWRPTETSLVWLSAARAVRTPSRFDTELFATGTFAGGPNFTSEDLLALELGYRDQPVTDFSFSVSTYFNIYDDLRTVEASTPVVLPLVVKNGMRGNTYGVEAWGSYSIREWWRLKAGASALRKELHLVAGSRDIFGVGFAGNDPSYQFQMQSDMDLPHDLALNIGLRRVDSLKSPAVRGYFEADAKIDWRIMDELHVSLAGVNLLHERHVEFINGSLPPLAIPRSVYLETRLQF
jgi:iron complex outermembrane receptor protein